MLLTSCTKGSNTKQYCAAEVLLYNCDPIENDASKLFIVESSEMFFSDATRTGYPHLYVYNFTTGYARKFSNQATIVATS